MIYIFWTCPNLKEAEHLIKELLDHQWIACANVFPEVQSYYRWKGKVEQSKEVKVLLKTKASLFNKIEKLIIQKGSYEVPEISMLKVDQGHDPYVQWLHKQIEP